ncbi:MAG: serine hydrolase domain-containing protein [Cellulophaga sp.]
MRRINISILSIVFILIISCKNNQQRTEKSIEEIAIRDYSERLKEKEFSGVILISINDSIIHNKGYGFRDRTQNILNEPNTIFDIGSITKQFTGAGIMKLVMAGELSLDDNITKYFNNVPTDKKRINIHHLLTHSSGLIDIIGDDYKAITQDIFINTVFKTELISPIGEKYNYSNVGYSLLAIVIEKISGINYEEYLNKEVFIPSDMHGTGYILPNWNKKSIAKGYLNGEEFKRPNEENWSDDGPYLNLKGNGGILSNVSDLLKWSKAINNHLILNEKATKDYLHPHILEYEDGNSFYGYGWVIEKSKSDSKLIWHNGGNNIFFADMWMFPEDNITIIVLCNKYERYVDRISKNLADILIKK